ncbi:MAG: hypothetical protein ACFFAJ_06110, partial [Candidatus Hodarchaeota archaeon]
MKKRIIFGMAFLLLILAIQSVSEGAALTVDAVKYHPAVVKDSSFTWKITKVDAGGETSWDWGWANNVTLKQGDSITLTWKSNPDEANTPIITSLGPINNTGLETKVGTHTMDFTAGETTFNFLIVPLYVTGPTGELRPMLDVLGLFWPTSYNLPTGASSQDRRWGYSNFANASLDNTGMNGTRGDIIPGRLTSGFGYAYDTEVYIFDISYDAVTGLCTSFKYPSSGWPADPTAPVANTSYPTTAGLDALEIEYDGDMDDVYAEGEDWGKGKAAPGFEGPLAITAMVVTVAIVARRR